MTLDLIFGCHAMYGWQNSHWSSGFSHASDCKNAQDEEAEAADTGTTGHVKMGARSRKGEAWRADRISVLWMRGENDPQLSGLAALQARRREDRHAGSENGNIPRRQGLQAIEYRYHEREYSSIYSSSRHLLEIQKKDFGHPFRRSQRTKISQRCRRNVGANQVTGEAYLKSLLWSRGPFE